jgi:hypothetical protein
MANTSKHRWINTLILESATGVPALPWERAAKRARRSAGAHSLPQHAFG